MMTIWTWSVNPFDVHVNPFSVKHFKIWWRFELKRWQDGRGQLTYLVFMLTLLLLNTLKYDDDLD